MMRGAAFPTLFRCFFSAAVQLAYRMAAQLVRMDSVVLLEKFGSSSSISNQ